MSTVIPLALVGVNYDMGTQAVLSQIFGFENFRPGQKDVVDSLMAGRNVLAVMPTGSGKSLCYQVPALAMGGLAVVVSPLVALMQDQVAALKLAGVEAETINSSASREDNVEIWRRVAAGLVKILYLAPERLMTAQMISALKKLDVRMIAVDEAHCISQWGASFRPEYDALQNIAREFPGVPIGAFTATADQLTRQDIVNKMFGGKADEYVAGFDRPNIQLGVAPKNDTKAQILEFLADHKNESGIIYSLSRKSTEEWAAHLKAKGFRAIAYHAGLSPELRADNQNLFMTEPAVIVCATIAFGMGIDKPDVRFVIHADLPSSLDAYYQEIGRAGRDGELAHAQMFYGRQDILMRRRFIDDEDGGEERRRRELQRLDALVAYADAPTCRRQVLLTYFGEESAPCGNCDMCLDPSEMMDGTVDARKVIETVMQTGSRYGAGYLADVLLGQVTDKVQSSGHSKLLVFGLGKDHSRSHWQSMTRQMVGAGLLKKNDDGFGGIVLTPRGQLLAKGEGEFKYRAETIRATRKDKKAAAVAMIDPRSQGLLQVLKALRLKLATKKRVPAYLIFSDRSLIDMAQKVPLTKW
ncbi:MAG: DNA helicase RecQ, partial [Aestuariivirga sp.]